MSAGVVRAVRVLLLSFSPRGEVVALEIFLGPELCHAGRWDNTDKMPPTSFSEAGLNFCALLGCCSFLILLSSPRAIFVGGSC